jgi:hypothetical protein
MAALALAQKTFGASSVQGVELLEKLHTLGLLKETPEEIVKKEEIAEFFKKKKSGRKKTTPVLEDRIGQYDGDRCDARIWKEKPRSGGLGFDNVQCSSKKVDGCGCLCRKHFKMQEQGNLWTGLITDPRPENPVHPTAGPKQWTTDENGDEVVKERKKRKSSPKKEKDDKPKKKKAGKKSPEEWSEEELMALLQKKKKEQESKDEQENDEQVDDEEEKPHGAGCWPTDEETEDLEDEDEYEEIVFEGKEYQLCKTDMTVVNCDDFSPVGKWDKENSKIIFDEDE